MKKLTCIATGSIKKSRSTKISLSSEVMYHYFAKTQTIVIKYAIQNQLYRIGVQFERKLIKFDRNEFIKIERCT